MNAFISRWKWGILMLAVVVGLWFNPDILFESETPRQANNPLKQVTTGSAPEAGFDFYVLALSWSPSFCLSRNRQTGLQCGGERFFSFIVHGLWPQFEKGWPSYCDNNAEGVSRQQLQQMLDIMPGYALITNQWRKHGTCSGLGEGRYFAKLRAAYDKIRIPAQYRLNRSGLIISPAKMEQTFIDENPGLTGKAIAITCGQKRLRGVRICLSKDLNFRPCPEVDKNSCRRSSVAMPPIGGG